MTPRVARFAKAGTAPRARLTPRQAPGKLPAPFQLPALVVKLVDTLS